MIEYESTFVGIPLPDKLRPAFNQVLDKVRGTAHALKNLKSIPEPHITLYYLGKQSEDVIPKITQTAKDNSPLLHNLKLTVGGLGRFDPDPYQTAFLEVSKPRHLIDYHDSLIATLNHHYPANDNKAFVPHVTLARLRWGKTAETFSSHLVEIGKICTVKWTIPVSEVCIYGINTSEPVKKLAKLTTFTVNNQS